MMDLVTEAYDGSPRLRTEFFKTPSISTGSAEGEMAFTRTGTSATNTGAPILDQAEEQGLTPEYGCRMGICFTCVSRKTEGTVRNVDDRGGVLPARRGHPDLRLRAGRGLRRSISDRRLGETTDNRKGLT